MVNIVRYNATCPLQANGRGNLVRYEDYEGLLHKYEALLQRVGPENFTSLRARILAFAKGNDLGVTRMQILAELDAEPNDVYLCINSLVAKGEMVPGEYGRFRVVK